MIFRSFETPSFFLPLGTTTDFCSTRTNKTLQPVPVSLMGRTPAFQTFQGQDFQTLRLNQGALSLIHI